MILKRLVRAAARKIAFWRLDRSAVKRLNLCCGPQKIPGYLGIDFEGPVDLALDLERHDLPFERASMDAVLCMSAINYFTRERGRELIAEVHRVLRPGGVTRFGVQDLESIAKRYVERDVGFFFQKLPDGRERFEGPTMGDKFAAWFYGYAIRGVPCRYFYDYDSLAHLFKSVGFSTVERKPYRESRLDDIDLIDNRPDQMFYLEAVK